MTIEDVRERFQKTEILKQFLPMLNEYIFTQARIEWLCTASVGKVLSYCAQVDE